MEAMHRGEMQQMYCSPTLCRSTLEQLAVMSQVKSCDKHAIGTGLETKY